jgi:molybdenum cofactor cytidylyltransferase
MKSTPTAVLILAAGASRRLGKPKQQLVFHDQTLLHRIIATAADLNAGPVLVVLNGEIMLPESETIKTIVNHQWQEGMSTSIRCGIEMLQKTFPSIETVIITVCDQPYVSVDLFQELIDTYRQTKKPIIACSYADTIGTPVLFHQSIFQELQELNGDKGARHLLNKDKHRVGLVNFPLGAIDIDTEEDYERLIKQ